MSMYLLLFPSRVWALTLRFVVCNLVSQPQSSCGPQKRGRKHLFNFVAIKIRDLGLECGSPGSDTVVEVKQ